MIIIVPYFISIYNMYDADDELFDFCANFPFTK